MQDGDRRTGETRRRGDVEVAPTAPGKLPPDKRDALNAQQERYMRALFRRGPLDRKKGARGADRGARLPRSS